MSLILCFVLFIAFQGAFPKSIQRPSGTPTDFKHYKTCPNRICTKNVTYYPKISIMEAMHFDNNSEYRLVNFFGDVLNVDVNRNVTESRSTRICESTTKHRIVPLVMKNTTDNWKYIVNVGQYNQTMRIEICKNSTPTNKFELKHINCTQRFQKLYLLTFENSKLSFDEFEVPIMCEAVVTDNN